MTTAVDEKVAVLKSEERAAAKVARADKEAALLAKAQREVAAEQRAADKAEKLALADKVETVLRAARSPYAEIHTGAGHIVRVDLGGLDDVSRGVAVEAIRRVAYQATRNFHETVAASRLAGQIVEERNWLSVMLDADAGLSPARKAGVVSIRTGTI